MFKLSDNQEWLKKMAEKEDNCCISAGGLLIDIYNNKYPQGTPEQLSKYNFTYLGFGYQKHLSGRENPFVIVFVYTDSGDNYLLSDMNNKVEEYLEYYLNKRYRFIYNKTYWKHGCRGSGWGSNCSIYFWEKNNLPGHKKYQIEVFGKDKEHPTKTFYVRRVPRRWLAAYDMSHRKDISRWSPR